MNFFTTLRADRYCAARGCITWVILLTVYLTDLDGCYTCVTCIRATVLHRGLMVLLLHLLDSHV